MPVGFSGDTHATWASLAYQPFFTATAATSSSRLPALPGCCAGSNSSWS